MSKASERLEKLAETHSVRVILGERINNSELRKPSGNKPFTFYVIPSKAFVLPGEAVEIEATVFPHEIEGEERGVVGQLLEKLGLVGHTAHSYIIGNHAGRLSYGECLEFVRAAEANILEQASEKSREKYGNDIFNVTVRPSIISRSEDGSEDDLTSGRGGIF